MFQIVFQRHLADKFLNTSLKTVIFISTNLPSFQLVYSLWVLDLISTASMPSLIHLIVPAAYLMIYRVYIFMAWILFLPLNCLFKICLVLLKSCCSFPCLLIVVTMWLLVTIGYQSNYSSPICMLFVLIVGLSHQSLLLFLSLHPFGHICLIRITLQCSRCRPKLDGWTS